MARDKAAQLKALERQVRNAADLPLYAYRKENEYQAVVGEGSPEARVMFIGEAPGKQEALKGRPFVGSAGRMLDGLLESIGLARGDAYITNILKDRPPENRAPQPKEIEAYTPYLRKQIEIIQPRVIVTLGRFAMDFILGEFRMPEQGQKISDLHGRPLKAKASFGSLIVLPLFHPAFALYRRDQKETLEKDFQALKAYV
ncbi:MAG TPA: uracil-DNA glycosylase [Anaerolineales bacterium]